MLPLLNDPYTTQLNKDRDGVTLEEFDLNVAKVYAIDGEQYIVIDVVGKDSSKVLNPLPHLSNWLKKQIYRLKWKVAMHLPRLRRSI